MARAFVGTRLRVATHNPGKVRDFQSLLAPTGVVLDGMAGLPEPEETGTTFLENARIKAHAAVAATGAPALADDSGLEVRGIDGAPGVYSADWAGPGKDFQPAMRRVHDELAQRYGGFEQADKACRFTAVLVLAWPDGHEEVAEGHLDGTLVWPPRGHQGFGYDPMVQPLVRLGGQLGGDETRTCGELSIAEKAEISHRGAAFRALAAKCWPGRGGG